MGVYQHIDGQPLDTDHTGLVEVLYKTGMLDEEKGRSGVSFCGIIHEGSKTHFFWPKTCTMLDNAAMVYRQGRLLLDTLSRYARRSDQDLEMQDPSAAVQGIPPAAALDLLRDYAQYGLYTNTKSYIAKRSSGNIAWSHVVNNSIPLPDRNGRPVYTDLYVRKQDYFSKNEISNIHAAIIARLDPLFGWYFVDSGSVAPELAGHKMPFNASKAIALLQRELRTLFSDREIRLVKNMVTILQNGISETDTMLSFTGIYNFAHIWEAMCSSLYEGQQSEFKEVIPYPAYMENGAVIPSERNRQRMDIIIANEKRVAVLDAKYYDITKTKPSWADLVKQFFYAKSLHAVMPDREIGNFLVCPKPAGQSTVVAESAVVLNPATGSRMDSVFSPVTIKYHDVLEIMEGYCGRNARPDYRSAVLFANP